MALDSVSKLLLPAVEEYLHLVINRQFGDEYRELQMMLSYHLGWEGSGAGPEAQGKRIRPLLLLLCTGAIKPDGWKCALPAAASVELIHNFSLIHDDIEDNSELRRGRPTVWKQWGIAHAINAGDTMFSLAQLSMHDLFPAVEQSIALRASRLLNQTCLELTQGQFLDLDFEKELNVTIDAYWRMVMGKTAALLSACTALGAIIGGADKESEKKFREFGVNLGVAFQVQDDFLGMWGNDEQTGKSSQSDLVNGKKSLPVLYGLSQGQAFDQRWKAGPIAENEAVQVADLLAKEGAREYTANKVVELTRKALLALDKATLKQPKSEFGLALRELTVYLLDRQA